MNQEDYRSCMSKHMGGGRLKGLSKEERKIEFCAIAKQCSKGLPYDEAKRLCREAAMNPKPPKTKRGRKFCTLRDLDAVSICLTENINLSSLTAENMQSVFSVALKKCSGVSVKRITSAKEALEALDPQQVKALETIALLSKEAEGRKW